MAFDKSLDNEKYVLILSKQTKIIKIASLSFSLYRLHADTGRNPILEQFGPKPDTLNFRRAEETTG